MTQPVQSTDAPRAQTPQAEAAAWFARRRSGEATAAGDAEFEAWLASDPRHQKAYAAMEALWAGLDEVRDDPAVLVLRGRARRRRPVLAQAAVAATLALAVGGGFWLLSSASDRFTGRPSYPDQTFRTELGQRSTVTLPDGSRVTLNTNTVLRTKRDGKFRLLYLDHGEAFFKVAKDTKRPFVVHAAGRTVTALGTAFDVRAEGPRLVVTLLEGRVRVDAPAASTGIARANAARPIQAAELTAGAQFTATGTGSWRVTPAKADVAAWQTGWLVFEDVPLDEIVKELGRYSDRKILFEDPTLAALRVSGRFKVDDVDGFLNAVELYDIAPVELPLGPVVRLSRRADEKN